MEGKRLHSGQHCFLQDGDQIMSEILKEIAESRTPAEYNCIRGRTREAGYTCRQLEALYLPLPPPPLPLHQPCLELSAVSGAAYTIQPFTGNSFCCSIRRKKEQVIDFRVCNSLVNCISWGKNVLEM